MSASTSWSIASWYDAARAEAAADPAYTRQMAKLNLALVERELPGVPREEVVRRLAAFNRRRLDAVPSLTRFPELRGMRELIDAQWRGAREGAELDDALWHAHLGGWHYYFRYIASGRHDPGAANCSMVYFPTSDRGPIAGKNLDTSLDQPAPAPEWPAISEHLVLGGVSSGVPCDEDSPELFPAPVAAIVSRYARTSSEAVELFERYNDFWGPGNQMVIDREHRVAVMEKTARRLSVRWSPDGFAFVTAMTQEDPELRGFVNGCRQESLRQRGLPTPCADTAYWAAQDKRRELMNDLFAEAKKNPTVESMRAFLQHRSQRGCVAGNGEAYLSGGPASEYTIRTQVWLLREGRAKWWRRDAETGKPSWENPQEDVVYPDVWKWE